MPGISYLSQTYKPEPYIQPMDLNVMAGVLSKEQAAFTEEGKKEQSQIDNFGSLDVMKGVDKQYLNGKINNLVTGLNNLGGINLADQNVTSKIEGLGSDIYGDPNIVNAVASTNQIRSLQTSYENLKTNPKLTKYYSQANEDNDNKAVNAYMSSDKVGDTYYGASSATNYVPYQSDLMKAMQGIQANLTTNVTSDGLTFITTQNKVISPERIVATATDLMTADQKAQMERDGMFAFKNADPLALVQQSLDLNNQKIQDSQAAYDKYKIQAIASGNDLVVHQNYLGLMADEGKNLDMLKSASKTIQSQGLQTYTKDPDAYRAQVYKDQFFRGLGERFATSQVSSKISSNPGALLQLKMQQQEEQFNQRMLFNAIDKGLGYVVDPKTGTVTLTGTKAPKAGKGVIDDSTLAPVSISDKNDPDLYKKTEQQFVDRNTELETKKAGLFNDYYQNYLNSHPDISQLLQSNQSGTGVDRNLIGQSILESTNGVPGLQLADLNFDPNQPGVNKMASMVQKAHPELTFDQAKTKILALKTIYDNYDKLSHLDHNPDADVSKIDPALSSMVEQYQLYNEEEDANNSKVKGINDVISKYSNLTPSETSLYNQFNKDPKSFMINSPNTITSAGTFGQLVSSSSSQELDPRILAIKDKISANLEKANLNETALKNSYYSNISNRPVYEHQILTKDNPLVKDGYVSGLAAQILKDRGESSGKIPSKGIIPAEDITPTEIGRNQAGTAYALSFTAKIGVDSDKQPVYKPMSVDLEPAEASQFGFNTDPYESLNQAVFLKGSTNPLLIAAKGPNGTLVTKIRIVKNSLTDRTNQESHAQLVVQDGNSPAKYLDIPTVNGKTPSEVYATMKTYIEQFAQKGLTLPQIVEQLKQYNQ